MQNSLTWNYWERRTYLPKEVDFCIVGAGISGLSAAIAIAQKNSDYNILVIDSLHYQSLASTRNAGFLCIGSPSEILSDIDTSGLERMTEILEKRFLGYQWIQNNINNNVIDRKDAGGTELFKSSEDFSRCADRLNELNEALCFAEKSTGCENLTKDFISADSDDTFKGFHNKTLKWENESQINPALLRKELKRTAEELGVHFLFGIEAHDYNEVNEQVELECSEDLTIKAKSLILACNAFTSKLNQESEIRSARNMILLSEPLQGFSLNGNYHMDSGYLYFRSVDERLLIGGGRNVDEEIEMTDVPGFNFKIRKHLEDVVLKHILPNKKLKNNEFIIAEKWSGFIGVQDYKNDFIKRENNVLRIGGYNGLGVTTGIQSGREIIEWI